MFGRCLVGGLPFDTVGRDSVAGTVKHARLETPTARSGLKRGRQPHWRALDEGKVHLGWQCWKGAPQGRWLLRRYVGKRKYRVETLGLADDASAADGERILSFKQASAKAHTIVGLPQAQAGPFTVRQAWEGYIEAKRHAGQDVDNLISRGGVHILPELGELRVEKLTKQHLRSWLAGMASAPAQIAPKTASRAIGQHQRTRTKFVPAAPPPIACSPC